MQAIRATMKAYKGDVTKVTKASIIETYQSDIAFLLRELAKAVKTV